jgi:hypothetical protein
VAVQKFLRPLIIVFAIISFLMFAATVLHIKSIFNPSDWYERTLSTGRMQVVENWDAELFVCPGPQFEDNCKSVSGTFTFEHISLPLHSKIQSRMREISEQSTHIRLRSVLGAGTFNWIKERESEEFLRPKLVFFKNSRCFAASGKAFCGQRTEAFDAIPLLQGQELAMTFPLQDGSPFGPTILAPVLVESNLLSNILALDDKATAAFTTEGTMLVTLTALFGALAALFPLQSTLVIMFLLCLCKTLLTALGYLYENQVIDELYSFFGANGYLASTVILNSLVLALMLYLTAAIMRGGYALSKLEISYGIALVGLFIGIAITYGRMGDLATASLFARDAIATLFGSIWIIYYLITEWQQNHETTDPKRQFAKVENTTLKRFVYLFFLVAYGAASAQTVLGGEAVPNLIPWQSLFFVPGISLAVLLDMGGLAKQKS